MTVRIQGRLSPWQALIKIVSVVSPLWEYRLKDGWCNNANIISNLCETVNVVFITVCLEQCFSVIVVTTEEVVDDRPVTHCILQIRCDWLA